MARQRRRRSAPVSFDELFWREDLEREGTAGADVARRHRAAVELDGQALEDLERTLQEGPLALPSCTKVYLPDGAGRWSMVLRLAQDPRTGQHHLAYVAFGQRHPAGSSPRPSVYELAFYRLHGRRPPRR